MNNEEFTIDQLSEISGGAKWCGTCGGRHIIIYSSRPSKKNPPEVSNQISEQVVN